MTLFLALFACSGPDEAPDPAPIDTDVVEETGDTGLIEPGPPNFMVIVIDDLSTNFVGAYGDWDGPSLTPRIDEYAEQGLLFENAWAGNRCTATRSMTLTGRTVRRTGMSRIDTDFPWALQVGETILPEALDLGPHDYYSAALGKWHISHQVSEFDHALELGFDTHLGSWGNLNSQSYFEWTKLTDGVPSDVEVYAEDDIVDDTLNMIATTDQPWFAWVALHLPHRPLHVPPDDLHTQTVDEQSTNPELYRAMVEAADTEIGRLLDGMGPQVLATTTVVIFGDNGSPPDTIEYEIEPPNAAKATMAEQGIHIPFVVLSPEIELPGRTDALVHSMDILPTFTEMAEVDPTLLPELDGTSFLGVLRDPINTRSRTLLWTEDLKPGGPPPWDERKDLAIRNQRYKLIWRIAQEKEYFYDLEGRYDDGPNLIDDMTVDQQAQYDLLHAELETIDQTIGFEY